MARKLILFELNEVPARIVDEFRRTHPRSNLARLAGRLDEWETFAEDTGHLSPWITWPSLHRGVGNRQHGVFAFGQDLTEVNREFPNLWQLTQAQGVTTGVCGSLHTYGDLQNFDRYAFYLPDTFAAGSECFPKSLTRFQEFNLTMARESARNVGRGVMWKSALRMLRGAPQLGLRLSTLADVGRQLVDERLRPAHVVRRRTYQGLLAFDVFFKQLRRTEPQFATFFTNHVASALHRYWAARFPADYEEFGFETSWVRSYGDEIDFAMRKFDRCLGDLVRFVRARPEYELWIASSMGQAATSAKPVHAELQIVDASRLMTALGVAEDAWSRRPAMVPQVNVRVHAAAVAPMRAALQSITVDGKPLEFAESEGGFFSLTVGVSNPDVDRTAVRRSGVRCNWSDLGLAAVPLADRTGITAYHIPQGLLLRFDPRTAPRTASSVAPRRSQCSTLELAPQILRRLEVPVPAYMRPVRASWAA